MSKPWATFLIFTSFSMGTAFAQPPVRKFDDPGSPPFKVLKTGENPPLDVDGNYVIGPEYTSAPERNDWRTAQQRLRKYDRKWFFPFDG